MRAPLRAQRQLVPLLRRRLLGRRPRRRLGRDAEGAAPRLRRGSDGRPGPRGARGPTGRARRRVRRVDPEAAQLGRRARNHRAREPFPAAHLRRVGGRYFVLRGQRSHDLHPVHGDALRPARGAERRRRDAAVPRRRGRGVRGRRAGHRRAAPREGRAARRVGEDLPHPVLRLRREARRLRRVPGALRRGRARRRLRLRVRGHLRGDVR
mmetsp:Transcript_11874/g.31159  ORF Transcript_11874/g.31159 Transcript_11874/m.31159 type:complete len:209 (-) Transcript_11874:37-663(-)